MSTSASTSPTVKVHYLKSPSFRTIHVDGIIGAPTPNGNIHVALFCERPAIPQEAELEMIDGNRIEEVKGSQKGRQGLVRELEVDAIMSLDTARSLHTWLSRMIEVTEQALMPKGSTPPKGETG